MFSLIALYFDYRRAVAAARAAQPVVRATAANDEAGQRTLPLAA